MPKNRKLQNIIGTEHITDAAEAAIAAQASGGATVAFKNVAVAGQDNIVADAATDTFNVAAGNGITLTTTAGTDTLTVAAAGYTYTATDGSEQFLISDTSDTALVKIVQEGTGAALQVHDAGSDTSILQVNQVGTVAIGHTAAGGGGYGKLQENGINYSPAHGADSGSASSPSFQFVGDQNTGMFSGGTDIIGFSTGGTERLAIGAAGEVLIGGTAAGTSGQVLTSGGDGAAITWAAAGGGGISELIVDDEIINSSYTRYNLHRLPIWGQIGTGAGTLSNQDAPVFRPFIGPHSGTITEFGIECTTADASGTTKAKIAIYTNQNGAPHTKMGEIDIPCTSTGATFITSGLPTVTLVRDTQYWWGYCRSNNTNSLTVRATSNSQVTWLGPSTSTGSSLNSQSVLQLSSSDNTMPTTITQANLVPTYIAPVHCSLKFS